MVSKKVVRFDSGDFTWRNFRVVQKQIQFIDPLAVVDSERNPATMWVTTSLTIEELMGINLVQDVILAN